MKRIGAVLLISAIGFVPSCQVRQEVEEKPPIRSTEYDSIMVVLLDMSGSYQQFLEKAFTFFSTVMDRFFRQRIGEAREDSGGDRIIIAQISGGVTRTLLFEGSAAAFRSRFGNAKAFMKFVRERSDVFGSRVHGGAADSLQYLLAMPGVKEGRSRSSFFVFSDMDDNDANKEAEKARLLNLLSEYGKTKSCLGMYWVDRDLAPAWSQHLRERLKHWTVHSDIAEDVPMPTWDE